MAVPYILACFLVCCCCAVFASLMLATLFSAWAHGKACQIQFPANYLPMQAGEGGLPDNPPQPFQPSVRRGPFTTHNGPWYHWADATASGKVYVAGASLQRARDRPWRFSVRLCRWADGNGDFPRIATRLGDDEVND